MVPSSSKMWGCATPILTGVLAATGDVKREAHGVGSGWVRTNQCSLWSTEKIIGINPGGTRHRQSGRT